MRGQFSIEFVIDVSLMLVLVAFLVIFFSTLNDTHYNAAVMNSMCSEIAQGINIAASSTSFSLVQYVPILNNTIFKSYNISVSNGILIIYLQSVAGIPASFVANTNIVSCGTATRNTDNESFGLSDLAVYQNSTGIAIAYLYTNSSSIVSPATVFGGGFPGATLLYLESPGGVMTVLANEPSFFVYSNATLVNALPAGVYAFYAQNEQNPAIKVALPFTVS